MRPVNEFNSFSEGQGDGCVRCVCLLDCNTLPLYNLT